MKTVLTRALSNVEATRKFAEQLTEEFLKPEKSFVLFLEGGLGAGKTLLVKEILKAFGVQDEVTSPTYTYVQEYALATSNQQPATRFAHFDLYRLENKQDFFAKGFQEIAEDEAISCFVEWPDRIDTATEELFTGKYFTIKLEHGMNASGRKATLMTK